MGADTSVDDYAAAPYPGRRPRHAYVQVDRRVLALQRGRHGRWVLGDEDADLDEWLAARSEVVLAGRVPLLCYGSNACPGKLQDLRDRLGLSGPVVMTPCTVTGVAAAWCAGRRLADAAVPATLVGARGTERHFLWWVAPDQWPVLDRCEGRGQRYDLVVLGAGLVHDDLGREVRSARAYVGVSPQRQPLVDGGGRPLLVRQVGQRRARAVLGTTGGQQQGLRRSPLPSPPLRSTLPSR